MQPFTCSKTLSCHTYNSCSVSINCSVFFCFVSLHKIIANYIVKLKVTKSCPTLCDSLDSTVCGILQARILEWVAFPFSRGSPPYKDQTQVSCIAGRFCWATREALPCRTWWNKLHSFFGTSKKEGSTNVYLWMMPKTSCKVDFSMPSFYFLKQYMFLFVYIFVHQNIHPDNSGCIWKGRLLNVHLLYCCWSEKKVSF